MAFWTKYTIAQLKGIQISLKDAELKKIEIAAIDDEGFAYYDSMKSRGFNIRPFTDIEDIRSVEPYEIVMCDIKGVGKKFGGMYEGAYVIAEIKKRYPHKVVIAYSSQAWDFRYVEMIKRADYRMDKNETIDRWQEVLDLSQKRILDPVRKWKDMAIYLVENDVNMKDVYDIEQAYIESCIKANPDKILSASKSLDIDPELKSAIISLASSAIFKAIEAST